MSDGESNKLFKCTKCEFKSVDGIGLRGHMKEAHREWHSCSLCNRKFIHSESLRKHIQKHESEKPYKCKFCKNQFAQSIELRRHYISVHAKVKSLPCPICEKKLVNIYEDDDDTNTDDVYPCTLCRCKFNDAESLKTHANVHYRDKPFPCNVCDAKFIQRSDLTVHMRYHTGERPFVCTICHSKFVKEYLLKIHMKAIHSDERPYTCKQCESHFKTPRAVRQHVKNRHTPKEKCKKLFEKKIVLKIPKKDKTKVVKGVNKDKSKENILKKSTDSQLDKKVKKVILFYACVTCKARFKELDNLKIHMRSHIVEKLNRPTSYLEAKPTRFELD